MPEQAPLARLGFGCSVLGGDLREPAQRALLDAALDAGIRHFDVAPSYGHGQAERVLGLALAPVRREVTVASKAGIAHPAAVGPLGLARRWLRPLKQFAPALWQAGAVRARQATAHRGQFAPEQVLATVQESLRRLQTDRLDHLLLHEVEPQDLTRQILSALRELQAQGLVGALGLGTTVEHSVTILGEQPGVFARVQTSHYWGAFTPALLSGSAQLLTHRCLRAGLSLVQAPGLRAAAQVLPGGEGLVRLLARPAALPELLVTAGLRATATGVLLLSSSNPQRVRDFARWVQAPRFLPEADLLNQLLQGRAAAGVTAPSRDD